MIDDCCLIFLTILFPPAGVLLVSGCGADFFINLCLTFLGFLPGLMHGIYVVMKQARKPRQQYVAVSSAHPVYSHQSQPQPPSQYTYNQPSQYTYSQPPPPPTSSNLNPPPYSKGN